MDTRAPIPCVAAKEPEPRGASAQLLLKPTPHLVETTHGSVHLRASGGGPRSVAVELNEILKIALKGGASDIHL
ncbi:MAG: hypothetical protein O7A09_13290, partial [Proteobacteria bacterium]|nr:hypothetical protein [Pseudomonadota bacterium]